MRLATSATVRNFTSERFALMPWLPPRARRGFPTTTTRPRVASVVVAQVVTRALSAERRGWGEPVGYGVVQVRQYVVVERHADADPAVLLAHEEGRVVGVGERH